MDKRFIYLFIISGLAAGTGIGIVQTKKSHGEPISSAKEIEESSKVLKPYQLLDSVLMAELALGVSEHPMGSNDGKRIRLYQETTGAPYKTAWCASFAYFCHKMANVPAYKSAWCPTWAVKCDLVYKKGKHFRDARTGDFILVYSSKKKRFDHITMIHRVESDYYITIGGNESNRVSMGRTHVDQVQFIGSYTERMVQ